MNAKTAKALRKAVRTNSSLPVLDYGVHKLTGSRLVNPETQRGVYLFLKKQYKISHQASQKLSLRNK